MPRVNVGKGEARFALTLAYWQVGEVVASRIGL
jgi:hypothetical protein